jgi:hypothetical protein
LWILKSLKSGWQIGCVPVRVLFQVSVGCLLSHVKENRKKGLSSYRALIIYEWFTLMTLPLKGFIPNITTSGTLVLTYEFWENT